MDKIKIDIEDLYFNEKDKHYETIKSTLDINKLYLKLNTSNYNYTYSGNQCIHYYNNICIDENTFKQDLLNKVLYKRLDKDDILKYDCSNSYIDNTYECKTFYNTLRQTNGNLDFYKNFIEYILNWNNYCFNITFSINGIKNIKLYINDYYLDITLLDFNDDNIINTRYFNCINMNYNISIKYLFKYNDKLYNDDIICLLPSFIDIINKNTKLYPYYYHNVYLFSLLNFVIKYIFHHEYLKESNQDLITSKQLNTNIYPKINSLQKEIKYIQDEINNSFKKIENNITNEIIKNYQENVQINKILTQKINELQEEIIQLKRLNNENDNNIKIIQEEVINSLSITYKKESNKINSLKQELNKEKNINKKLTHNINFNYKQIQNIYNKFYYSNNIIFIISCCIYYIILFNY